MACPQMVVLVVKILLINRWSEFPTQLISICPDGSACQWRSGVHKKQLHDYKKGEFGSNGLYYMDANGDAIPGTAGLS